MSPASQSDRASPAPRRFRPRLWSTLLTVLGCAAFIALGFWQIARGQQKARLDAQLAATQYASPVDLNDHAGRGPPPTPQMEAARAQGRYLSARQLLLDDQSIGDHVGYDVLTPMKLADGGILMVNRGWVPGAPDRDHLPSVQVGGDLRAVRGLWRRLPAPGLRLQAENCRTRPWPRVVSYPTHADLQCLYGQDVRRGELLLAPAQRDGYVRKWKAGNGFTPLRHYSYALQWFAFAALALFLYFRLNYKSAK